MAVQTLSLGESTGLQPTGQSRREKLAFTALDGTESLPSGDSPAYLGLNANEVHYFVINPVPAG